MAARFELFGTAHLLTLGLLVAAAVSLVAVGQRARRGVDAGVRAGLAVVLIAGLTLNFGTILEHRGLRVWDLLPLHLCDLSIFLALGCLALGQAGRKAPLSLEILLFWTLTGTLLACVTPALRAGFPDRRYLSYFLLHGGVIWTSVYLVFGRGLWPRAGAALRVFAFTLVYAACVGAVDFAFGKNYLYLLRKPRGTMLDYFGAWPTYIATGLGVSLVLFALLELGLWLSGRGRRAA